MSEYPNPLYMLAMDDAGNPMVVRGHIDEDGILRGDRVVSLSIAGAEFGLSEETVERFMRVYRDG